jgi:hypothetical protein
MAVPTQAIRIEAQWNGAAISARHWITLHLIDRGAHIEVRVSAPHYADPPPPDTPVGPTDRLWEYEVVELFIHGADDRYTEIELSPSGHHLVLQLQGVRQPVASMLPIQFESTIHGDRWTGTAVVDKKLLPEAPLRMNATAIHGSDSSRTYLSWVTLPGQTPDFHQPEYFHAITWATQAD